MCATVVFSFVYLFINGNHFPPQREDAHLICNEVIINILSSGVGMMNIMEENVCLCLAFVVKV